MTFNSLDALESYILSQSAVALRHAQVEVFNIIDKFLMNYYSEFSPEVYQRTQQLLHSLVKSDIKSTGNGWVAEVYFDVGLLDYSMKTINGVKVPNKGWSEAKTLSAAAHGSHGGWVSGTAIWDDPMKILDDKAIDILKNNLVAAGIPIK